MNSINELGFWQWLRWRLANKKRRAKMIIEIRSIEDREFVTVKCNDCGEKICFCPAQVMHSPKCKCGNNDIGDCRYWQTGKFGNFELVEIYIFDF